MKYDKETRLNPKKGNGINDQEHKDLVTTAKKLEEKNRRFEKKNQYIMIPIVKGYKMVKKSKWDKNKDLKKLELKEVGNNFKLKNQADNQTVLNLLQWSR
jgi:hypothetical protein